MAETDALVEKILKLLIDYAKDNGATLQTTAGAAATAHASSLLSAVRGRLMHTPQAATIVQRFEQSPVAAAPLLKLDLLAACQADPEWEMELAQLLAAFATAKGGDTVVGDNNVVVGESAVHVGRDVSGTVIGGSGNTVYINTGGPHDSAKAEPQPTAGYVRAPRHLLDRMDTYLGVSDLRTLCFELQTDYENLEGQNKRDRILSLILQMEREHRVPALMSACRALRPKVPWESG